MEDYIFLIIAIVLSIFGAINKKKKKGEEFAPTGQVAEKPSRNYFMDQLLGEDFLEEPEEEVVAQPVKPRPKVYAEPVVSERPVMHTGLYHSGFKSTLPERKKYTARTMAKKVELEEAEAATELSDEPGIMEDFSLRKAFIYSEILQRKY